MKATEAMALKNLLSNWRVEAKAIHDGHACLELVLLQLTLEHPADQKAYERRL